MERLESVQYSAALAVTGGWNGTSREKFYEEELGFRILKPGSLEQKPYSFLQVFLY